MFKIFPCWYWRRQLLNNVLTSFQTLFVYFLYSQDFFSQIVDGLRSHHMTWSKPLCLLLVIVRHSPIISDIDLEDMISCVAYPIQSLLKPKRKYRFSYAQYFPSWYSKEASAHILWSPSILWLESYVSSQYYHITSCSFCQDKLSDNTDLNTSFLIQDKSPPQAWTTHKASQILKQYSTPCHESPWLLLNTIFLRPI